MKLQYTRHIHKSNEPNGNVRAFETKKPLALGNLHKSHWMYPSHRHFYYLNVPSHYPASHFISSLEFESPVSGGLVTYCEKNSYSQQEKLSKLIRPPKTSFIQITTRIEQMANPFIHCFVVFPLSKSQK